MTTVKSSTTTTGTAPISVSWAFKFWHITGPIQAYLEQVEQVATGHRPPTSLQRPLSCILALTAYQLSHHLYLSFFSPTSDPVAQLAYLDIALLVNCPSRLNLLLVCFSVQVLYFLHRLYWLHWTDLWSMAPILLVKSVLMDGDNRFFVRRRMRPSRNAGKLAPIDQIVKRWVQRWTLVLRYYRVIIALALLYLWWLNVRCLYRFRSVFFFTASRDWRGYLLVSSRLAWNFYYYCHLVSEISMLAYVNFVSSVLFTALTAITFIQLRQVTDDLLVACRLRSLSATQFAHFRCRHTEALSLVLSSNRLIGPMLLSFYAVYVSLNTYLVSSIYHRQYGPVTTAILVQVVVFQFLAMIGCHLVAIAYTSRIHRPVTEGLMHWSAARAAGFSGAGGSNSIQYPLSGARATGPGSGLHTELRLAGYIERFHTNNRYGITYGGLETVMTFATFGKCGLFYCQWFMYWYKLFE